MMRRCYAALLASACFLLAASSASAANRLTNGSFEDRVVTGADVTNPGGPWSVRSTTSTPGWTQYLDGVDLIHNNYTQPDPIGVLVDASDGVNFLDMNQAGVLGGLYQEVAAVAGTTYTLSLDVTAWVINGLGGTVGYALYDPTSGNTLLAGAFTESVANATWDRVSLTAEATSNRIGVRIYGVAATQAGMGVDNVSLTGGVPEPATWATMILGLGGVGAMMRRRRLIAA